jgi:hypothetical protein
MTTPIKKHQVVLGYDKDTPTPEFITNSQNIHDVLLGNTDFPDVQSLLAQFQTDIDTLMGDHSKALTRVKGSAATANEQKALVYNEVELIRATIQSDVNKPVNFTNGVAMVQGASMYIKGHTIPVKPAISVKYGELSGELIVIALSVGHHAAYEWAESTDGITFKDCARRVTLETRNPQGGFTPGTTYYFRVKPVLPLKSKTGTPGEGNWSQAVKILAK